MPKNDNILTIYYDGITQRLQLEFDYRLSVDAALWLVFAAESYLCYSNPVNAL